MRKMVTTLVVMTAIACGTTRVMAQKTVDKEAKKIEREIKRQERKAQEALAEEAAAEAAADAIREQSFVLEAKSVQPLNGPLFFVNSSTNFVSLNNGQAMVQIASNAPYPGPNGLGGITVQGSASNAQIKEDDKGNLFLSMNVQGVFISATVILTLPQGTNQASVTIDPNFSGRNLSMNGSLLPYNQSNVFQGTTY